MKGKERVATKANTQQMKERRRKMRLLLHTTLSLYPTIFGRTHQREKERKYFSLEKRINDFICIDREREREREATTTSITISLLLFYYHQASLIFFVFIFEWFLIHFFLGFSLPLSIYIMDR